MTPSPLTHPWIRWTGLITLLITGIVLGYLRWTYVIIWESGPKFIYRFTLYTKHPYPNSWSSLWESVAHDPRWLSLLFYSLTSFGLSVGSVYLYFLRKDFVKDTVIVYAIAWILVVIISSNSIIFPSYAIGLGIAQNLKNLLQTPFFTILLMAIFRVVLEIQQHHQSPS